MDSARPRIWRDAALASAIALLLSAVWAIRDWTALSALHLPDTDDVVRLQQIRDWLGGQAFGDLAQHRLGLGGVEMHWSRLPDLAPAAIIALGKKKKKIENQMKNKELNKKYFQILKKFSYSELYLC